jgi:predicted site-specific integrase-resolvase
MKVVLGITLYTLKEVGELLGVQTQTASKYVSDGKIKARVIGGIKYVTEEGLKEFLLSTDKKTTV